MLRYLNLKKRIVMIALSAVYIILLFLPTMNVGIAGNETTANTNPYSFFSASTVINDYRTQNGLTDISTEGIDRANPADDTEKATLVLADAATAYDLSFFLIVLTLIAAVLGAMTVFAKPNSKFGFTLFSLIPFMLAGSYFLAQQASNIINENFALIAAYNGLSGDITGVTFSVTPLFYVIVGLSLLTAVYNITFRKTAKENNESEKLAKFILGFCAIVSVVAVLFITIFLAIKSIPTIAQIGFFNFLFTTDWNPTGETPTFGIAFMIITSLVGTLGAILVGVPIGLLTAICISQILPKKTAGFVSGAVDLLAGIPSVIYGVVGVALLVPAIKAMFGLASGLTLLAAILVLSIMVLPTIVSVTTTSLNAVPATFMEASLALGLTKEMSVFKVIIPAARSGIMTGVMLGLGRAIGEAMAIILVAGNTIQLPEILKPVRFLTTGIVAEMGYATGLHRDSLFAIGLVLFVFILIINAGFRYFIRRASKKYEQ